MNWAVIRQRLYADLCMPSRLGEYRLLLKTGLEHGYEVCSLRSFWRRLRDGLHPGNRYFVLRHDVDSGIRTARQMWEIDQELGINSSYYFRLHTAAMPLMRSIEQQGGEASYHFEELSALAKRQRIRDRCEAVKLLPQARDLFARNLAVLRERSGLRMEIVAGHGDWMNRRLGLRNSEILASATFRQQVQIELEAYDSKLMDAVRKHSDGLYPDTWGWGCRNPIDSIRSGLPAIHVLVHPGNWQAEPIVSVVENARRLIEELRYWTKV